MLSTMVSIGTLFLTCTLAFNELVNENVNNSSDINNSNNSDSADNYTGLQLDCNQCDLDEQCECSGRSN